MVFNIILQLECKRWHPSSQSMCKTCQVKRSLNDNSTQHHRWAAKFVCSNSYCNYLKCQIWSFPNSSMCHPRRCSSTVFAPQGQTYRPGVQLQGEDQLNCQTEPAWTWNWVVAYDAHTVQCTLFWYQMPGSLVGSHMESPPTTTTTTTTPDRQSDK